MTNSILRRVAGGRLKSATVRSARAFTSAGDGNWNTLATWTDGIDYPRLAGDTVTIAAGHEITIPVGLSVAVSAITVAAGTDTTTNRTILTISGTLTLGAALVWPTISSLTINGDGILDLAGNTMSTSATDVKWTGTGSSGHLAIVRSTGSRGAIAITGTPVVTGNWNYTSFTGLNDSAIGRSQTTAIVQILTNSVIDDCEDIVVEQTGTTVNAGFTITGNHFRNPHSTGAVQPKVTQASQALGTGGRVITGNTFENNQAAILGVIGVTSVVGLTFSGNVIEGYQFAPTANAPAITDNMWLHRQGIDQAFFPTANSIGTIDGNYFYSENGNHPWGVVSTSLDITDNIVESRGSGSNAADWFLTSTTGTTVRIQRNLWLGIPGIPITVTAAIAPTLLEFSNNTVYADNGGASVGFPFGIKTELTGDLTGNVEVFNNLLVKPTGATTFEPIVNLRTAVANQIDVGNWNGWWDYPSGARGVGGYIALGNPIAGLGVNDVHADPGFVDKDRTLATWDLSLGGAGTVANARAEMLKLNAYGGAFDTDYTLANLMAYVKAGFVATTTDYDETGRAAADIGAYAVTLDANLMLLQGDESGDLLLEGVESGSIILEGTF